MWRRRTASLAILLSGLLAFVALPAAAQVQVAAPADPWIHTATGTPFPATVDEFERRQVFEYSEDGRDAGVNYLLRLGADWVNVSLYIYPVISGQDCRKTYEDAKGDVAAYAGARLLSENLDPAPAGRGDPVAFHARYHIPAGSMRGASSETRSDVYLHCPAGNEWLVKYRATWTTGSDFTADVERLLHSIAWPANLGG
jgi:hypothetical protein